MMMLKLFKWLGFEKKSYVFPTFYFVYSFTLLYNNEEKKIETYFDIQNYSLLVYEGSELLMTHSLKDKIPDIWATGLLIDVVLPYYVKKSLFKTEVTLALKRKYLSRFPLKLSAYLINVGKHHHDIIAVQPVFNFYNGIFLYNDVYLPPMATSPVSKE